MIYTRGSIQEDKMDGMKAYLVFNDYGPVLILTKYDFAQHPELLDELANKTTSKFIAFEVSIETIKDHYSAHLPHVFSDPKQSGNIKTLDEDGREIFANVSFKDLSGPIFYEH